MKDSMECAQLQILRQFFKSLAAQGFQRPPGMSAEKFITLLSEFNLLSSQEKESLLSAYSSLRYQEIAVEQVSWEEMETLFQSFPSRIETLSVPDLDQLKNALCPPPPRFEASLPTTPPAPTVPTPKKSTESSVTTAPKSTHPKSSLFPLNFSFSPLQLGLLLLGVGILFGVTGLVVGVTNDGDLEQDVRHLAETLGLQSYLKPHKPNPYLKRILRRRRLRLREQNLRYQVSLKPSDASAWSALANFSAFHHRYGDAILFYQRSLKLNPRHVVSLNNLAWLYCTSSDPYFRSPRQGLALAEQAYKIDPAPFVIDTLAEAYFLHGKLDQAIKLQKVAIQKAQKLLKKRLRVDGGIKHYSRHLQKFLLAKRYHEQRLARIKISRD